MSIADNLKIRAEDYRGLPDGPPHYQLIDGELHMSPSPSFFHQSIAGRLFRFLGNFLDEEPLGEAILAPTDVFLTDTNVFQPDLLFVSRDRLNLIEEDGVYGAPDLVVEILSPGTKQYDLGFKKKAYAACGVMEYWIIDPDSRLVSVYYLRESADLPDRTLVESDTLRSPLLPGLEISLKQVFVNPIADR